MDLRTAIAQVTAGGHLSADEMAAVVGQIMEGLATPAQIGGLLVALRMRGETVAELVGAARAMRARVLPVRGPEGVALLDTCGTGGDGKGTLNVSTVAALVAAGAGAKVAKHGNRAQSSRSGSADVLEALGVEVAAGPELAERSLREVGIAFLFAPTYHGATRHAAGPRRELGTRTIFNLLGPLTNPAGARHHVAGVYDPAWCEPMARALGLLGSSRAFVVHGHGGLDELATDGPTRVAELGLDGEVALYDLEPADFGLARTTPADGGIGLAGGEPAANAAAVRALLEGAKGPARTAVLMAAACGLVAVGVASDLRDGIDRAAASIDRGDALDRLERLRALCPRPLEVGRGG